MNDFYQWIDVLWLPVIVIAAQKRHALLALGFMVSCMLMMRLQVELMGTMGFDNGFLKIFKMSSFERGLITYSVFYLLYATYAHYARNGINAVFLAASISAFFAAFFVSSIVMMI